MSRVKAEDREGFDKDQAEFEVCVAADTEWTVGGLFPVLTQSFLCPSSGDKNTREDWNAS